MALPSDLLFDRANLKKQLTLTRVGLLLLLLALLFIWNKDRTADLSHAKGYIARITIDKEIYEDPQYEKALNRLAENKSVKAVILRINSPGGTEVGSEILYHLLRKVAQEKPLVSVMGTLAASGGYMIALASEQIFARHGTLTGSIGAVFQSYEASELLDKLGIKYNSFKSSPLKGEPSLFEPITPEVKSTFDSLIADCYNNFVNMIVERRNLPRETVLQLANGQVYSGRQAVDNKLIDQLGGEDEALKWLQDNKAINADLAVVDVDIEGHKDITKELMKHFGASFGNKISALKQQSWPVIMSILQQK